MVNQFSIRDYASGAGTDPRLEFRLTNTPIGEVVSPNLGDYAEVAFNGYGRIAGNREQLFAEPNIDGAETLLRSHLLSWNWTGGPPLRITAILVVAVFGDSSELLVKVVPQDFAFTATSKTFSASVNMGTTTF